jgi:hypothetical protein
MIAPSVLSIRSHDHRRGGGFAAAGFAYEANTFPAVDREADTVNGFESFRFGRGRTTEQSLQWIGDVLAGELLHELLDDKKRRLGGFIVFGARWCSNERCDVARQFLG